MGHALLLKFVVVLALGAVLLAACGGRPAATSGSAPAAGGRAEARLACERWAGAGKAPGASALSTHATQAAAAKEGTRAAAADGAWRGLAKAMTGSVRLPLAMLTERQQAEAGADLAAIRRDCGRLGVQIAA